MKSVIFKVEFEVPVQNKKSPFVVGYSVMWLKKQVEVAIASHCEFDKEFDRKELNLLLDNFGKLWLQEKVGIRRVPLNNSKRNN